MEIAAKLQFIDLRSTFLTGLALNLRPRLLPISHPITHLLITGTNSSIKSTSFFHCRKPINPKISSKLSAVSVETSIVEEDIESLFSENSVDEIDYKRANKKSNNGASSISSGVRTVKEELMSAFKEGMEIATRLEKVQKSIEDSSKLMLELGFAPEDSDRLVATFSGGWQMRMSLGKNLLQVSVLLD
ncbi:hypothetical protein Acr_01g0001150 [Actinidia rufa]|uniref:Uncharacterized protein n=1 Tax=Actinidia rufa TaxID=165716 RepID=A0A7J0E2D6_9ERIC|nr:hypothetical protein Acr_01g0001150 [Actinidia rufa]